MEVTPWDALQPKKETLSSQFIQDTKFDGTNVIVAILDTGVDPGAAGLLQCPDGTPKVIDVIDCTGSGDVDTKTIVETNQPCEEVKKCFIKGLSGRNIILNPNWINPSGKWRIGVKRAYELFPKSLSNRVAEERKKKWNTSIHNAQIDLKFKISNIEKDNNFDKELIKKMKKDYEERLEVLISIDKAFEDPGPLFDTIIWHDGENWCGCVDSSETGDLSEMKSLRSYYINQEYSTFSSIDNLNYTITIFDDGNVCSICTDVGSHGTHVAGIVAAYHPEQPEQNGVAPGAKIVSFKIGDTRMGSMETTIGLMRALTECVKHKVDVINMSYGEACSLANDGRFVELANEIVYKHGIVFVSSAGNNGPALSTVGAPGGTTSAIIGVAAMVSPAMMLDQYSISQGSKIKSPVEVSPNDGVTFTWSSKGPAPDGDLGVSITAPGAAISPVPTWSLQANQLMNGTSMSSPNAAGCVALVLSGCKANGWNISPNILRRGLENSCKEMINSPCLYSGHGLVQVPQTYKWIQTYYKTTPNCHFDINVNGGRGIYLRTKEETMKVSTHMVFVKPVFHEDTEPQIKTEFDLKLIFKSDVDWLKFPDRLSLNHGGRGFNVIVDPTNMLPGVHSAMIKAIRQNDNKNSSNDMEEGALFEVQITVLKPMDGLKINNTNIPLALEPGAIQRSFLTPPKGATWFDITLTDTRDDTTTESSSNSLSSISDQSRMIEDADSRMIVVHLLQLTPKEAYSKYEKQQYLRLRPGQTKSVSIALLPQSNSPLEVCLAQFWSSPGNSKFNMTFKFRGVNVIPNELVIGSGQNGMVKFHANLNEEEIDPKVVMKTWRQPLLPSSFKVVPLGDRDILPNGKRCYELILEYTYTSEGACAIVPRAPLLNGLLYDAHFDAQLCMIFNENKKYLGTCDTYPEEIKLSKEGKYLLRYSIRHDSLTKLNKLEKMLILIDRKLKDEINLPIYSHKSQVAIEKTNNGSNSSILLCGNSRSVVVGEVTSDKFPKGAKAGDVLLGTLTCVKKSQDFCHPNGWNVTYIIPLIKETSPDSTTSPSPVDEKKDILNELNLKIEKLKIETLNNLSKDKKDDEWNSLYQAMINEVTSASKPSLSLRLAKVHHYDRESTRNENLKEIITSSNELICEINQIELSSKLGLRILENEDDETILNRKKLEEQKTFLIDALFRKTRALLDLEQKNLSSSASADSNGDSDTFEKSFKLLQQWEDITSPKQASKYAKIVIGHLLKPPPPSPSSNNETKNEESNETKTDNVNVDKLKLGGLLKYINSALNESTISNELEKELREVKTKAMSDVGWSWMAPYDDSWALIHRPKSYTLH